jgi:tryptophan halogenase
MDVPPDLAERMDLFRQTGRIRRDHDELFTELAWSQVMIGQGCAPVSAHPITAAMGRGDLAGFMDLVDRAITAGVAALPGHGDWLAKHAAAREFRS